MDVGNLISGSSAFSKSILNIWKFLVHLLLKPSLQNFQDYFASMWDECNCVVVWTFFGIAFLWDWNENTFSSPVAPVELFKFAGKLSVALSQHHLWGFEIELFQIAGIPSPPLALFIVMFWLDFVHQDVWLYVSDHTIAVIWLINRLRQTCLWVFECLCGGTGQQSPATWTGALATADLGSAACG